MNLNFHDACRIMERGGEVVCTRTADRIYFQNDQIIVDFESIEYDEFLANYADELFEDATQNWDFSSTA